MQSPTPLRLASCRTKLSGLLSLAVIFVVFGLAAVAHAVPQETKTGEAGPPEKASAESADDPGQEAANADAVVEVEDVPKPQVGKVTITADELKSHEDAVNASSELDEESKKRVLDRLSRAAVELDRAGQFRQEAERFERLRSSVSDRSSDIEAQLAELESLPEPSIDDVAFLDMAELEVRAREADAALLEASRALADAEAQQSAQSSRPAEISAEVQEATRALQQTELDLQEAESSAGSVLGKQSRRDVAIASRVALEAQLAALEAEQQFWSSAKYLSKQYELARRTETRARRLADLWNDALAERRSTEADAAMRAAESLVQRVDRSIGVVDKAAATTLALAEERQKLSEDISRVKSDVTRIQESDAELRKQLKELREQLDRIGGLVDEIGRLLRSKRRELPTPARIRNYKKTSRSEIGRAETRRVALRDLERQLFDIDELVAARLEGVETNRAKAEVDLRLIYEAWKAPDGFVSSLNALYDEYARVLYDRTLSVESLESVTTSFTSFIDERVLWIPSGAPGDLFRIERGLEDLRWLTSPSRWGDAVEYLVRDVRKNPVVNICALLIVFALIVLHSRFQRMLVDIGENADKRDSFAPTAIVLGLTLLLSLVYPLAVGIVAWRLVASGEASTFTHAVAGGLRAAAILFLTIDFFRRVCRPRGLADSHFKWSSKALRALRVQMRWLMIVLVPVAFVVTATDLGRDDATDTLGSFVFFCGLIAFAVFCRKVASPSGAVIGDSLKRKKDSWLYSLRYVWYPATILVPLGLAVMTVLGYYYTSRQLAFQLQMTVWLLIGLVIAEAMTHRWLLLARRRLALERARAIRAEAKQAAQAAEAASESGFGGGSELDFAVQSEQGLDFASINAQTRQLVRAIGAVTLALGLWFIWIDVFPALRVFDSIELFGRGTDSPVTLANLGLTLLYIVLTIAASRNIPGLLEVTLLQRLKLEAGEMYAVTSIARYVIVIVGGVMAFGSLGIGWSKVQWLAAALSVGLGFGLQEIVANFVSGIILLIERPMRVGDIVTIGTVSGKVTRIRIRATTITDWDRRELIVPNKSFITGDLINWTLSDTINRLVFPVGVAYGTDTRRAREILLDVARANPYVLEDPAPSVLFKNFGESSLDLDLRVYLPDRDNYISVVNTMNTAIDEAFREANIEIPFPQRDVHVVPASEAFAADQAVVEKAEKAEEKTGAGRLDD